MNILKFLDEKKLTQQELGDAIGTSNQNVNRWVTGKGVPSYEFCKKLLEMGMSVDDLFDIEYGKLHGESSEEESQQTIKKEEFMTMFNEAMKKYTEARDRLNDLDHPIAALKRKIIGK